MTGPSAEQIGTVLRGRRSGRNWMVRCPAHDDRSPSLSITDRGGRVLVHCHAGCPQSEVIDALRARGLWPEKEQPVRTPIERAERTRRQRDLECVLPDARSWRRAAINMTEDLLNMLKAALFDPMLPRPQIGEISDLEQLLSRFRRLDGAALVGEFHWWRENRPGLTTLMIRAAKDRERIERLALREYLRRSELPGDAA